MNSIAGSPMPHAVAIPSMNRIWTTPRVHPPSHVLTVLAISRARSYIRPLMMQHHDVLRAGMENAGTGPIRLQGLRGRDSYMVFLSPADRLFCPY